MSELQLALLGAGVFVVAAVWGYNQTQERKHKKLAEKIFQGGQPDVLLQGQGGDARSEPSMAAAPADERVEPAVTPLDPEQPAPPPALPAEWADAVADCTLRLGFEAAVAAPALWAVQSSWAEQIAKPLIWLGLDEPTAEWRRLDAHDAGSYFHVAVALQLADRQGAVSDAELAAFLDGTERLAQHFGGAVELPLRQAVLAHAQELDGFCASVDVQLAVNVVEAASGAFPGTKLRGLAEAAGLVLREDGRFHACDETGREWFSLGNLGSEVFDAAVCDRMVATARKLAQSLDGVVVDGQRHPLADTAIAAIRAKIVESQQQMAANQIAAGSPRALRLFS
ncbi:MAG: hypothetical protein HZC24_09805 [Rhodocyclales bacterium]|nr:hypothetical protein [Rhodocyclales bacterium]